LYLLYYWLVQEFEISVPVAGDAVAWFEDRCSKMGLLVKRLELKKFPGCTHWHLTKPGETGTLEATWWRGRLWLSVHDNRKAEWQNQATLWLCRTESV
jgi:hypothetical protein